MIPLRRSRWTGEGGTRGLLACAVQGRLDEVLIDTTDTNAVRSLLKSGLPFEPGPAGSGTLYARPLLTASALPPLECSFSPTTAEVAAYGAQSGDLNPLHFDDAYAHAMGFEGRMIHGMLFNGWLTRYLGMRWPGPGTLFKRSDTLFLAPVYPDRDRGHYRVVAQLADANGRHCMIAYADLVHRDAPLSLPAAHGE